MFMLGFDIKWQASRVFYCNFPSDIIYLFVRSATLLIHYYDFKDWNRGKYRSLLELGTY